MIRPGTAEDVEPAYHVFRRALWSYLRDIGLVDAASDDDPGTAFARHRHLVEHLADTAAEFHVAVDDGGRLVGLARSIERDEVFQLTELFVDPDDQGGGIGTALLAEAFPVGRGRHRSILATLDPRALSLYHRYGVAFQGALVDISITPEVADIGSDLLAEPVAADSIHRIAALDATLVGFERLDDLRWLAGKRPCVALTRHGSVAGYAFLADDVGVGPIGVADTADAAAALDHVRNAAAREGRGRFSMTTPLANHEAMRWAVGTGQEIEPFFTLILADAPFVSWDRYIGYTPEFFI